MTIECVSIETNHFFYGNPIAGQHKLRYEAIIQRQNWPMPTIKRMEYDQYDNPSTIYLIWRDDNLTVRGSCRLCSTKRDFMLKNNLSYLVNDIKKIPCGEDVLEGSRFCIDKTLSASLRLRVAQEIVIAYLEYGLSHNISKIIGVMYPVYWKNLFEKNGWNPNWLGNSMRTEDGKKSRAGYVDIKKEFLELVRENTGIYENVISYGDKSIMLELKEVS